uniref:Uncharacterized protein n=1 Tax=Anopheles culicifacies TaxID=139723 RepID=A0A182MGX2_9DIPT
MSTFGCHMVDGSSTALAGVHPNGTATEPQFHSIRYRPLSSASIEFDPSWHRLLQHLGGDATDPFGSDCSDETTGWHTTLECIYVREGYFSLHLGSVQLDALDAQFTVA